MCSSHILYAVSKTGKDMPASFVCVWLPHVCINALGCLLKTVNRIMLLSFALDFTTLGNVGAAFLGILYENVLMGALMDTLQP